MTHKPAALRILTLEEVRAALRRTPLPGAIAHARMAPPGRPALIPSGLPPEQQAAVLLLLYPREGQLHFVLTRRAAGLSHHGGQIALPGGRFEARDGSLARTALREGEEELGADLSAAELLGALSPLYVPSSRFVVHPFVASLHAAPTFAPPANEVTAICHVPLGALLEPTARTHVRRWLEHEDSWVEVPAWRFDTWEVWGATAMLLSEFAALLEETCKIETR